ncbi:hypothetical protein, partial [Rhizobium sp. FKL33]|uniref:hypothetical protein n=1 Tax=Rhizobium sp. FKL33 TaxID=2562307 RepID=UPI00197DCAF3
VRDNLLLWVAEYGATPEAQFVYKAWLDVGGEVGAVRESLLLWVERHGTTPKAGFVYQAWLDGGGEVKAVRRSLLEWVEINSSLRDADFVFRAWLAAGERLEPIKSACEAWLAANWSSEDAVYVTKELSKTDDLSYKSVAYIFAWAGTYPANEDAIFRIGRVSKLFPLYVNYTKFPQIVATTAKSVLQNLFKKNAISKFERNACAMLFSNLSHPSYPHDENWRTIVSLYCNGLRHGAVFWNADRMPSVRWELLLHEALSLQLLDPTTDAAAIRHAHDLIRQVRSQDEYAALIASGFIDPPPDAKSE